MMKMHTFQFQQATIFTATLLFQPQLITTLYIQLQTIIYKYSIHIIYIVTYGWPGRASLRKQQANQKRGP